MADTSIPKFAGLNNYPQRLKDNGDGTWSELISVSIISGAMSLADQSVVDAAGVYWLVRDNGASLTYVNWATGAVGTPTAPVAPAGKLTGEQLISTQYTATTAATGYVVGDVLSHIVILNIATSPATVLSSVWANITQGSILAAPSAANISQTAASMAISSMPAIPAGTNLIGSVTLAGTLPAFTTPPTVNVGALPALPAGANVIGSVNLDLGGAAVSSANPVPIIDAYQAPTSTTWTAATAANSAATFTTNGYDTVIVSLVASAAFAGGVVVFEVFDGTNWLITKAASILNYTTTGAAITPVSGSSSGYQIPVAGFPQFRVRLASAMTAGTLGLVTIISSAPDTSLVTVGLDPAQPLPGGTNNIGAVTPAYLPPQAWTGTAIDMRAYGTVTITCTVAPSAGTVSVSPDNASDYIGQTLVLNNAAGIVTTLNLTATGVYTLSGRAWIQGAITGGTCFISGGQ